MVEREWLTWTIGQAPGTSFVAPSADRDFGLFSGALLLDLFHMYFLASTRCSDFAKTDVAIIHGVRIGRLEAF